MCINSDLFTIFWEMEFLSLFKAFSLLLLSSLSFFCLASDAINLSKDERLFIKNNPIITLGGGESFEPFLFKNSDGTISGYDREVANLIEQKTGLKINFELGVWNKIQARAKSGELDGISTAAMTEERRKTYNYSDPYLTYSAVVIVNRANPKKIYKKEDTQFKKAAVQRGNVGFERLTKSLENVDIVYYDDIHSVLNAVVNNQVDFTILDESAFYIANMQGSSPFISTSFVIGEQQSIYFALTKKKPLLASIFSKALSNIGPYQLAHTKRHWFNAQNKKSLNFSEEEKAYLHKKEKILLCINPDFYPIESNQNGLHIGISADFFKAFQEQLSLPFQVIETDSWSQSLKAIKNGDCDLLPTAMKTPLREQYLNFTPPYLFLPLVIATKNKVPFIQSLSILNNYRIGIVKDYAYSELLQQQLPKINIIEVDNLQAGLTKVKNGELFGVIDTLPSISHQFQSGQFTTLKITGKFDQEWLLSIAVRKDEPILQSIFSKLVNSLDEDAQQIAFNKYISVNYESFVDYSITFKVIGFFLILLFIILFWNQRIQTAKKSLDKRYRKLEHIKDNIQENENRLKIVLAHSHIGNWELNVHDLTARCSLIHDQIFGYDSQSPQWTYGLFISHIFPDDKKEIEQKFQAAIKHKTNINYECRIIRKDGAIRWVYGSGGQEVDSDGEVTVISGILQDITDRKLTEIGKSQHHAELQGIFNALPDIYFRMTLDGLIVDYHAQHEKQLYLDPKDFIGKPMQSVLPPDIGNLFQKTLDDIAHVDNTLVFTYQLSLNDELLHFEARLKKISNNDQVICVIRDITDAVKSTEFLAASEQRFRSIFEQAAIGVALVNIDTGQFIRVNQRLAEMLGYRIEELTNGKSFLDITHPDDIENSQHYANKIHNGQPNKHAKHNGVTIVKRYLHKKGYSIWVEITVSPSIKLDGLSPPVIAVIQDISERKKSEEELKLAATVFTHAAEGIVITDEKGSIIDINGTFTTTTGYSREEIIGKNPRFLSSGRQSPDFYEKMWASLNTKGYWSGEIWNRRKNNEIYAEMLNISSVKNVDGEICNYVGLFTDITVMKQHQQQLEHTAHYDLLTNLPNRTLLSDRLSQAMAHSRRHEKSLAVVFLDLDGFKAVNDKHGHAIGDELLVALSISMKGALREGDTLARIGGDEFVAVLADLDKVEDCEPVLDRLLSATSAPIIIGDLVLNISSSIGVTLYPQDNVDTDLLMRHADQAMYAAKESGKNHYHLFDTAQDDAVKIQREKLESIRNALDTQQFVLYYQPKVNMRTGRVIGVEALIRWRHPTQGLLNPIEFLPVIENSPMSIELGEWVIEAALIQIEQWQNMGLDLPVSTSVNIAATQLQQPDFTKKLAALIAAHPNVEPYFLELEVLETSALDDVYHVSKIMKECIALGVKFALDDFGTGYSSLTYLRRLPASLIKIDQSFVRDMLDDPDDLAIVEGVIALANSFKREVIAEGVETIEHGTALLQLGCELAQGYGIAKPMPANEIPAWVEAWKPDKNWQHT